jgi:hypothetical protein
VETNAVMQRLLMDAVPVRRLWDPRRRTAAWLAASLPIVGVVLAVHLAGTDVLARIDLRIIVEETAILLTALAAAFAALSSVVPGRDRRLLLLPVAPLTVWLASLGESCVHDWLRLGAAGVTLRPDWDCAAAALLLSIVPATAMIVLLRRGAPLMPRVTLVLGALAVAALVNLGLRIFHAGDISIMVLLWHFAGAALASLLVGRFGRHVLNWRSALARSGITRCAGTAR